VKLWLIQCSFYLTQDPREFFLYRFGVSGGAFRIRMSNGRNLAGAGAEFFSAELSNGAATNLLDHMLILCVFAL